MNIIEIKRMVKCWSRINYYLPSTIKTKPKAYHKIQATTITKNRSCSNRIIPNNMMNYQMCWMTKLICKWRNMKMH